MPEKIKGLSKMRDVIRKTEKAVEAWRLSEISDERHQNALTYLEDMKAIYPEASAYLLKKSLNEEI